MIELKNISYHYNKSNKILENINLNIEDGKITAIVGKNGCGKSTLLRCINLLEKPTSGEILFRGENIFNSLDLGVIRREIGMVFQQFNLFENMTVLDNIIIAPTILKIM